jgi:hypothetical protein
MKSILILIIAYMLKLLIFQEHIKATHLEELETIKANTNSSKFKLK